MDPNLIELKLIAIAIYERYGYDFREYAIPSLQRRFSEIVSTYDLSSVSDLQHQVLYDPAFFYEVLERITVTVSDFYRDPKVWKNVREHVVPYLKTFHALKFWSAGCSNGQEAYSLAILLHEEGLLERSIIHATDINPKAIEQGKSGSYRMEVVEKGRGAYQDAGGVNNWDDYFETEGNHSVIKKEFRNKVLFNHHNLASESSFGEMAVVFCRNTLIYFQPMLQEKVINLLNESLQLGGYLILGSKEGLAMTSFENQFENCFREDRIFKKATPCREKTV